MKISNIGHNKYIDNLKQVKKNDNKTKEKSSTINNKDSLEISDALKNIKKYVLQSKEPNVDLERVHNIKNAIQSGEYKVMSEELATKIIQKIKE